MYSAPLFLLSLCIPLPPVNQGKVVSQAWEKAWACCFLMSLLLQGPVKPGMWSPGSCSPGRTMGDVNRTPSVLIMTISRSFDNSSVSC